MTKSGQRIGGPRSRPLDPEAGDKLVERVFGAKVPEKTNRILWYTQFGRFHSDGCFELSTNRAFLHELLDEWLDGFCAGDVKAIPEDRSEPLDEFRLCLCTEHAGVDEATK